MLEFASTKRPKPQQFSSQAANPSKREDMPEIIAAAHNWSYDYLATNGTHLVDTPGLAKAKRQRLNYSYLSFDSFHEEVKQEVRVERILDMKP